MYIKNFLLSVLNHQFMFILILSLHLRLFCLENMNYHFISLVSCTPRITFDLLTYLFFQMLQVFVLISLRFFAEVRQGINETLMKTFTCIPANIHEQITKQACSSLKIQLFSCIYQNTVQILQIDIQRLPESELNFPLHHCYGSFLTPGWFTSSKSQPFIFECVCPCYVLF